jgi:3D (Asp-Asp-Asp) domain-containing protein
VGKLAIIQPHGTRSSSMSIAMRRKHERGIYVRYSIVSLILIAFMLLLMHYGSSAKQVTLVVNGEEKFITTREWDLDRLLAEQEIVIGLHDRLSLPSGELKHGDRIVIDHTHPINLIEGEKRIAVHTVGHTVSAVLDDLGIELGELDRTEPSLDTAISENSFVRIIRVNQVTELVEKELPYSVVTKNDNALAKGKEKVVQEGKEGVLIETILKTFEDGVLAASQVVDTTIRESSVDEVIAVGTLKPVTVLSAASPTIEQITKKGLTFGVKQILTGVRLTVYDAGIESTGKDVGHPQYGITFSGAKVKEGQTIAVDPKVIPMGWWVYIEGIGFRKAEDTGSAIKGKKIDVYYDDADEAGFGVKKNVTVYVIGPKKPEAN